MRGLTLKLLLAIGLVLPACGGGAFGGNASSSQNSAATESAAADGGVGDVAFIIKRVPNGYGGNLTLDLDEWLHPLLHAMSDPCPTILDRFSDLASAADRSRDIKQY